MKMNYLLRLMALTTVGAMAFLSCSRDLMEEPEEVVAVPGEEPALCRTIWFHATQAETKARFGDPENDIYPTLWTSNDSEAKISLNYAGAIPAVVTPSQDGYSSTLSATVDFTNVDGPYTFYAVSPSSAAMSLSPSRHSWKVTIPCEQSPTAGSVDENAIILAASSIPFQTSTEISDVDLYFSHLTAYGRVSLTGIDLIPDGATVQAIELTATTPLVGDWFWACEASGGGSHTLIDYGASSTVTINTDSTDNVWFACAPVSLSGEMMTVRVITDQGVLEKLIEFDGTYELEAGTTAVFSVDMSEAAGAEFTAGGSSVPVSTDFTLVTDASALKAGDEVLIVSTKATDEYVALGESNGNYRLPAGVTVSNNAISDPGEATVLTLKAGTSDGTFAFFDGEHYLSSPTTSNNYLHSTLTSVNANASWSIDITNGLATVTAQAGTRTLLRYNSSSPRFSCYASGQTAVSIYRRRAGGVSTSDPMLLNSDYGCYLGTGLEWILSPGSDQVTRSYNSDGILTYTLINPEEVEELEISGYTRDKLKGDAVTLSVSWRRGTSYLLNQSYHMTIIKEQGPKVWLSDGSGKGVIIKK